MSLAQTDDSVERKNAIKGSARLLKRLIRHHGTEEERAPAPQALPPIPNRAIAIACEIAFPKTVLNQVEAIQIAVLREYPGITMADLKSARRTAKVVNARQVAMYIAKEITARSLPDIGRRFGGRDHTTVLHAVRKIEGLVAKDEALCQAINRIKDNIPEIRI